MTDIQLTLDEEWLGDLEHAINTKDDRVRTYTIDLVSLRKLIAAARAALAQQKGEWQIQEPVYKTIERILDEESAWIARPSKEVTRRVAFAATVAAHTIIAAQAAAARAHVQSRELQPIETAPRDGTPILGYTFSSGWIVVRFQRADDRWATVPGFWACTPTHWRPLPITPRMGVPPIAEERTQEAEHELSHNDLVRAFNTWVPGPTPPPGKVSPELQKVIEDTKAEISACFDGAPASPPVAPDELVADLQSMASSAGKIAAKLHDDYAKSEEWSLLVVLGLKAAEAADCIQADKARIEELEAELHEWRQCNEPHKAALEHLRSQLSAAYEALEEALAMIETDGAGYGAEAYEAALERSAHLLASGGQK